MSSTQNGQSFRQWRCCVVGGKRTECGQQIGGLGGPLIHEFQRQGSDYHAGICVNECLDDGHRAVVLVSKQRKHYCEKPWVAWKAYQRWPDYAVRQAVNTM